MIGAMGTGLICSMGFSLVVMGMGVGACEGIKVTGKGGVRLSLCLSFPCICGITLRIARADWRRKTGMDGSVLVWLDTEKTWIWR